MGRNIPSFFSLPGSCLVTGIPEAPLPYRLDSQ